MVNLWLGFPYFFLVCSGALTAIPSDLKEAAYVDGASGRYAFRTVVLPLLLVATAPLLVTTFAFNFNNYTLIELLTGGGPFPGTFLDGGSTDLLINFTSARRSTTPTSSSGWRRPSHADLRDRRDGLGVRLPADQATRGDRHMSDRTRPRSRQDAAPLKADRMPFGRWLRLVGWRHLVAIIFVHLGAVPGLLRGQPGVLRRQHAHRGVPAGASRASRR